MLCAWRSDLVGFIGVANAKVVAELQQGLAGLLVYVLQACMHANLLMTAHNVLQACMHANLLMTAHNVLQACTPHSLASDCSQ